jgi:hydrogenase expression/formation protein HypD
MKYLDEYRDGRVARKLVGEIRRVQTKPWVIMEVCGGQTHSIVKHGIDYLLPEGIELVHGPGCPVCVTPLEMIDKAHSIARRPDGLFCSFGDRAATFASSIRRLIASRSLAPILTRRLSSSRLVSKPPRQRTRCWHGAHSRKV